MPTRKITVPAPVEIIEPMSRKPTGDKVIFADILWRLLGNPLWQESFAAMRSHATLAKKLNEVIDGAAEFEIGEDDWALLKQAVETPRTVVGGQIMNGFAFNPAIVGQLVPLLTPIMEASASA